MRPGVRVAAALSTIAILVGACAQTSPVTSTTDTVTSGDCADERAVVRRALDRSNVRADVDGDGRQDTVAVASRPDAQRPCRGFVAVRLASGETYSNHLFRLAVPLKGLEARLVGLPTFGEGDAAAIVVDTAAAADSMVAQIFTLSESGLRAVPVPGFKDRTLIVDGGGVVYPFGSDCTRDGRLVLSRATQTQDGSRYRVMRRTYEAKGDLIRFVDPTRERATVPVDELVDRFPEFGRPHWTACTRDVSR